MRVSGVTVCFVGVVVVLIVGKVSGAASRNTISLTTPNSFNIYSNTPNQFQHNQQQQQWYGNGYNRGGGGYANALNYYRGVQPQQNHPYYADQYQNQGYHVAENQQNPIHAHPNYDDEDSFHLPQMPLVVMEPIRRMYHVYEDNVRGIAKRFRNAVYAPMKMMG